MTEDQDVDAVLSEYAAKFIHDPLGFVRFFYKWGEGELEGSDGPRDWQIDILNTIGQHLRNPATRYQPLRIAIASGHGIGKAQPVFQMIHTPLGLRRWGDVQIGDYLFDDKGGVVRVTARHPRGELDINRVVFDDGSETLCCDDHLWTVRGRKQKRVDQKKAPSKEWITLSTKELVSKGLKRKNGKDVARAWELPTIKAVPFRYREVPVDPYTLGVWLGDGGRMKPAITSNDPEVVARIRSAGYEVSDCAKQGTTALSYYLKNTKQHLIALEVYDKYSYEKSVPETYKINDMHTRAEVLRGLLDTDGEVNKNNSIGFSTTSIKLAEDVIWLVRSLGGKAKFQPTIKRPFYRTKGGNKVAGRLCHRLTIRMPDGFQSFYIKRKQDRVYKTGLQRSLVRWIDRIEFQGTAECMCVTVENADGIYLTNDFIPTHNSSLISMVNHWALSTMPLAMAVITANTEAQLRTKTFVEAAKWLRLALNKHWFKPTATSISYHDPLYERAWRSDAIAWSETNPSAFAGMHNKGKRILLVYDEAAGISDKIYEVSEGALTDEDTEIIWLAFGNPTRGSGRFKECFGRFKHRWVTKHIDSRTVDGTNKAQIDQWVNDYGEDSDFVRVRVRGEFPRASSMQFIADDIVEDARKREATASLHDPLVMGVDISRFGDDETVIVLRRGRDARSIPWVFIRGQDTVYIANRIMELNNLHKPDAIFIDGGGIGGGVIDILRRVKLQPFEVQFGAKADDETITSEGAVKYYNKRASMWGGMKDWLRGGAIPDDPDLATQLTSVEFSYGSADGKIKQDALLLEKKTDMKKRGLSSPDRADALACTFCYTIMPSDHTLSFTGRPSHGVDYNPLDRNYVMSDVKTSMHKIEYNPIPR